MEKLKIRLDNLDLRIALSVVICLLTARFIPVIQYMSACFAVILCMQENVKTGWKTGITRIIITAIGGIVGILVVLLDDIIGNEWVLLPLAALGILLTILGCKLVKVPYISTKIGCVTFILVIMVERGSGRILYAALRLLGTFYGVIISLLVTAAVDLILKNTRR